MAPIEHMTYITYTNLLKKRFTLNNNGLIKILFDKKIYKTNIFISLQLIGY